MWEIFDSITGKTLAWEARELDAICRGLSLARIFPAWDYTYCRIGSEPIPPSRYARFLEKAKGG